jgi:hypothetical protein
MKQIYERFIKESFPVGIPVSDHGRLTNSGLYLFNPSIKPIEAKLKKIK